MARLADVPLVWLFGEVKTPPFSAEARVEAGFLLRRLQQGETLGLPQSRPMPTIGTGCHELRIPDRSVTWRIVYHVAWRCRCDSRCVREEDGSDTAGRARDLPPASHAIPRRHQDEDQTMKQTKKARLEAAGWRVSDAAEFLGLSDQERRFVELKLALASGVRQLRERRGLTQAALAKQLRSSQSRVAKMEAADTSVSLDLMMRSLLSIGATPRDIAKLIRKAEAA